MRTSLFVCLAAAALALSAAAPAQAQAQAQVPGVSYDLRGTFASGTSTTALTAPGAFDLQFSVPVAAQGTNVGDGGFDLTASSFRFTLGGTPVTGLDLGTLSFFNADANGGFTADLTAGKVTLSFNLSGDVLFGGSIQTPTFKTGTSFAIDGDIGLAVAGLDATDLTVTNLTLSGQPTTVTAATPEPPAVLIVAVLGVLALAAGARARRAAPAVRLA